MGEYLLRTITGRPSRFAAISVMTCVLVFLALIGPGVASAQSLGDSLSQPARVDVSAPTGAQSFDEGTNNGKGHNGNNGNGNNGNGNNGNGNSKGNNGGSNNGNPSGGNSNSGNPSSTSGSSQPGAVGAPGCAFGNNQKNGQTATAPGCTKNAGSESPATGAPGCAFGNDQKNGQTATAPGCAPKLPKTFFCGNGASDLRGEHQDNDCAKPLRGAQGSGTTIVLAPSTPGVTQLAPAAAILAAPFSVASTTLPAGTAITIVAMPSTAPTLPAATAGSAVTLPPGAVFTVNGQPSLGQIQVQSAGMVVLATSATAPSAVLAATASSLPKAGGPLVPLGTMTAGGLLMTLVGWLIRRRI